MCDSHSGHCATIRGPIGRPCHRQGCHLLLPVVSGPHPAALAYISRHGPRYTSLQIGRGLESEQMKGAPRRRGWTCGEEVHDQDIVERELGAEGIGYGENLHKSKRTAFCSKLGGWSFRRQRRRFLAKNMQARTVVRHTRTSLRYSGINEKDHESKFGNTRQHSAALCIADRQALSRAVPCRTVPTRKT